MHQQCRIELFGGLRVLQGDQILTHFTTRQCASLLAYLACHLHRTHPREVLATLLWPDAAPEAGRTSLNNALSSLRRQLEPPGIARGSILQGDRQTVGLNPDAVTTDILEFENLLKIVPRTGSSSERGRQLSDALNLYRGELLPGFYEDWVFTEQRRLAGVYFHTLDRLIAHFSQTGEYQPALQYVRRAVRLEPLREESHLHLMRLYIALNQPAAALQQYHELTDLLQQQLGTAPSAAIRQFIRDIEHQPAAILPPLPVLEAPQTPSSAASRKGPPTGTVTFLAAEIEEANTLPERMENAVLERCSAVLRAGFANHGGYIAHEAGGSFLVAFAGSCKALTCALASRQALTTLADEEGVSFNIRIALYTGDVSWDGGGYDGFVLDAVRRMAVAAHGGQMLCSQTTAELLRHDLPPDVLLADLGLYRLRGNSAPERMFQVAPLDLRREFPPLRMEAGYQSHLPRPLTRFFGREAEIAQIQEALRNGDTRFVTLTGPGGAGKTRLSLEVAHRLVETFSGAVWFVPLVSLSDARLINGAIADAIGLPRSPILEPLQQVAEALSRQPSLLVLDNFEHLAREGGAVLQTLLERVPTLTCLLTSRQALALTGEREFPLASLLTPQKANTPEKLILYESVRLFVDRAQATRPDFQVTNHNALAVAELCSRLEGIPLAIELAAARAQTLTPAQMLAQMEHPLDLLVSRKRDIEARHRTLRAAIDWSYRLLSPDMQRFFVRLSVFRGGWTEEAAESVCEAGTPEGTDSIPGQASEYLLSLCECSLILADKNDAADVAPVRFRMLETLRQYAWETLTPDEQSALERRHAEFFLQLAAQAVAAIQGSQMGYWLDRLEAEHDNLRSALQWAREGDPEVGLRLAVTLPWFWEVRGHWREGYLRLTDLLERNPDGDAALRAKALMATGNLAARQGNYAAARIALNESYRLHEMLGFQRPLASVLNNLGLVAHEQADYAEARRCYEASLAIKQELGDRNGEAISLMNIGYIAYQQGDLPTARRYLETALAILRETTDKRHLANALNNLGGVTRREGDYNTARSLLEESLNLRREIGDQPNLPYSLDEFAYLAAAQGEAVRATRLLAAAEAMRVGTGSCLIPAEQEHRAGCAALLRSSLGEENFRAEWQRGHSLTVEQAISIAYKEPDV